MARCVSALWLVTLALAALSDEVRAEETPTNKTPELLVVMTDGRILRGQVNRHAVGCYVERPGGSILIPKEQIRCVARDLRDAYRLQREQMLEPTSAMMIQLAEWCISYRLYDEAGDELRRAVRRDPENETARKLLARLDEMLRTEPAKTFATAKTDPAGFVAAEVESLGGLSKPTAAEFTAKIQPLLINKCANSGCHGGAGTESFRLVHVRLGSPNHRHGAEQNLAAVLKMIDVHEPQQSPLLKATQGAHGGAAFAFFGGANGTIQRELLEKWVKSVVAERKAEAEKHAQRTPLQNKKSNASAPAEPAPVQMASAEQGANDPAAVSLAAATSPAEPDELPGANRPPRPLPRHDPFDPEEFNQQTPRAGVPPRLLR